MSAIIAVDRITKRYGGLTAVDACAFEVPRGSITGLIGPNGAGKTTLFNIIAGVTRPDHGRILLDGKDVTDPGSLRVRAFTLPIGSPVGVDFYRGGKKQRVDVTVEAMPEQIAGNRRDLGIDLGSSRHWAVQRADDPSGHGVLQTQRRSHRHYRLTDPQAH